MAGGETERLDEATERKVNSDVDVLRSGREEARVVLDHQLQLLSEIHTKAMRTVRITILVLSVVLSAAAFSEARRFVNWSTVAGVGCLAGAILTGLVTYSASDPDFGAGPDYLLSARTSTYDKTDWLELLIEGYEDWIHDMEELNDGNARMLTYTQMFLGIGVVLIAVGILTVVFV
jgi:hypothetical protein